MQVLKEENFMLPYQELFTWWAIVIGAGIGFIVIVSVYLYVSQLKKLKENTQTKTGIIRIGKDFVFVWVTLILLTLYIVSIGNSSSLIFALGNIIIEIFMVIVLLKNKSKS
jgi:hypothetical protein